MVDLDRDDRKIDIHHIFPKKWCKKEGIPPRVFNSIINKTAVSYKANRKIGSDAPSGYLHKIQSHPHVQLQDPEMDVILRSHFIDPTLLRADDFQAFYSKRKDSLIALIQQVMGKSIINFAGGIADDEDEEDEETAE